LVIVHAQIVLGISNLKNGYCQIALHPSIRSNHMPSEMLAYPLDRDHGCDLPQRAGAHEPSNTANLACDPKE